MKLALLVLTTYSLAVTLLMVKPQPKRAQVTTRATPLVEVWTSRGAVTKARL